MGHSSSKHASVDANTIQPAPAPISHEDAEKAIKIAADSLHLRLSTEEAASLKARLDQLDVPSEIRTPDELYDFLNKLGFFETEFYRNIVKTGVTLAETGGQLVKQMATNDEMKKLSSKLLFEEFDIDHNHVLDPNELMRGLLIYAVKSTDELIKLKFTSYDADNSGFLTKDEIHHLLNNYSLQTIKMLKITILIATEYAMDECGDSERLKTKYRKKIRPILEEFEKEALKSMNSHLDQIQMHWIEITDSNHDGKISIEEFKTAFDDANTQKMTDFVGSFFKDLLTKYLMKSLMSFY